MQCGVIAHIVSPRREAELGTPCFIDAKVLPSPAHSRHSRWTRSYRKSERGLCDTAWALRWGITSFPRHKTHLGQYTVQPSSI
ncbi:hypothetical protein PAXRUDRAFT_832832 [Paxillus rubicundulus Ve08.2h10]|uniref:Uncharacterized protein n=1 Tax=Paxillus rubicundulus Ve08.2h10 TaxID=930991 RepID=A0A0D0DBM4_9AGAM|nr:hypothetical protein PAXRUDRAFT_832832 [Paxillus rubicundulus Ve08.2h10]